MLVHVHVSTVINICWYMYMYLLSTVIKICWYMYMYLLSTVINICWYMYMCLLSTVIKICWCMYMCLLSLRFVGACTCIYYLLSLIFVGTCIIVLISDSKLPYSIYFQRICTWYFEVSHTHKTNKKIDIQNTIEFTFHGNLLPGEVNQF